MPRLIAPVVVSAILFSVAGLSAQDSSSPKVPRGLPALSVPKDNPLTPEKIALGKQLYFDKRLSRDNTVACVSCHDPAKGWSNGERFATGCFLATPNGVSC